MNSDYFSIASITNLHKFSGLNNTNLLFHSSVCLIEYRAHQAKSEVLAELLSSPRLWGISASRVIQTVGAGRVLL